MKPNKKLDQQGGAAVVISGDTNAKFKLLNQQIEQLENELSILDQVDTSDENLTTIMDAFRNMGEFVQIVNEDRTVLDLRTQINTSIQDNESSKRPYVDCFTRIVSILNSSRPGWNLDGSIFLKQLSTSNPKKVNFSKNLLVQCFDLQQPTIAVYHEDTILLINKLEKTLQNITDLPEFSKVITDFEKGVQSVLLELEYKTKSAKKAIKILPEVSLREKDSELFDHLTGVQVMNFTVANVGTALMDMVDLTRSTINLCACLGIDIDRSKLPNRENMLPVFSDDGLFDKPNITDMFTLATTKFELLSNALSSLFDVVKTQYTSLESIGVHTTSGKVVQLNLQRVILKMIKNNGVLFNEYTKQLISYRTVVQQYELVYKSKIDTLLGRPPIAIDGQIAEQVTKIELKLTDEVFVERLHDMGISAPTQDLVKRIMIRKSKVTNKITELKTKYPETQHWVLFPILVFIFIIFNIFTLLELLVNYLMFVPFELGGLDSNLLRSNEVAVLLNIRKEFSEIRKNMKTVSRITTAYMSAANEIRKVGAAGGKGAVGKGASGGARKLTKKRRKKNAQTKNQRRRRNQTLRRKKRSNTKSKSRRKTRQYRK
jgi:hypothetical protein